MSREDDLERSTRIDRRKFLTGVGAGAAAGLAGCLGGGGGGGNSGGGNNGSGQGDGGQNGSQGSQQTSEQQGQAKMGGKPRMGMASPPNNLNVLASSTAYANVMLDNIYTFGTYSDPESGKPIPGGFENWELTPENVGSGDPAIVAEMRDDLTFNDGEKVTAEDFKFTVEYVTEQEAAGTISASQFSSVESVEVDSPDGTTVNLFLSEKDRAWLTDILGNVFLPKHVWKDVADYKKYTPRNAKEGIVGSGPFMLRDFNWENWYELSRRKENATPWNSSYDFLDERGPFIDALRVEVFGSESALNQAMLNGDIDQTYDGIQVEKAAQATNKQNLNVVESQDDGYAHISYNVRRKPLDDPAFRQLLNKMQDKQWTVETLFKGIGAENGTWATPTAFESWRPPEPLETGGSFEGIRVPDLSFPGQTGSFNLSQQGVDAARSFLTDNPQAKYDYSLGEAQFGKVNSPDGQAIYVDGEPIGQAHTDNNGEAGQGPLEMSFNPPSTSPKGAQLMNTWVGALRTVGIPVAKKVQSFNSQLPKVYSNEDFDIYEMGWTGLAWANDHYTQFYGSEGADLDGSSDAQKFNAMGYTNADDLINEQGSLMEFEPRKPIVKKLLARIYSDAPTNIAYHNRVLQPVTKKYTGRVEVVGGVTNVFTWLNIRQA